MELFQGYLRKISAVQVRNRGILNTGLRYFLENKYKFSVFCFPKVNTQYTLTLIKVILYIWYMIYKTMSLFGKYSH